MNLGFSIRTVEVYRARVIEKLNASNFPHLIRMALVGGIGVKDFGGATSAGVIAPAAGLLVARGRRRLPADRSLEPRTGNLRAGFFGPGTRHAPVGRPHLLHGAAQQSHGCNIPELIRQRACQALSVRTHRPKKRAPRRRQSDKIAPKRRGMKLAISEFAHYIPSTYASC